MGARQCTGCQGTDLVWEVTTEPTANVPDGRYKANEFRVIFYLGCNECSDTIEVVRANSPEGEAMMRRLNMTEALMHRTLTSAVKT